MVEGGKMKNKKVLYLIIIVIVLILIGGGLYFILTKDKNGNEDNKTSNKTTTTTSNVKIVNLNSKTRPFAVMINNHPTARAHHAGLQDAYIIYEFIVEGGMTRYLALFKDQDTAKIGSVRSSRHYFLDYALENDAIYVHWGWSPQAQNDIKTLGINNINGLYDAKYFYRDQDLKAQKVALEHTGFTTMEKLKNGAKKLKYNRDTNRDTLLNYQADEVNLEQKDGSLKATNAMIKYSGSVKDTYEYDAENKVYKRFVNGKAHTDDVTKKQYTFKNIIVYNVKNSSISGDDKGRQEFDNIGKGIGYYITNGYAVPIRWEKTSRSAQTKYTYENGKEIEVNDGNTFIEVQPTNQELTIS